MCARTRSLLKERASAYSSGTRRDAPGLPAQQVWATHSFSPEQHSTTVQGPEWWILGVTLLGFKC